MNLSDIPAEIAEIATGRIAVATEHGRTGESLAGGLRLAPRSGVLIDL